MHDDNSPALEQTVDPDLMRRVAWGLLARKTKAEIAAAEGLTPEECEIVCTAPGMFSILNVWVSFLERREEGGRKNARKLTGWCVEHVFQHAPERLAKSEIWRLDRLSAAMLHYGFAIVFGWMLAFLDGVMGVPGARPKDLGDFKQNLVDLLCWAVEVTFREKMLEQHSVELLIAKDGAFQAAIAGREIDQIFGSGELRTTEGVPQEQAPPEPATVAEPPALSSIARPASPRRPLGHRSHRSTRTKPARRWTIRPPLLHAATRPRDRHSTSPPSLGFVPSGCQARGRPISPMVAGSSGSGGPRTCH